MSFRAWHSRLTFRRHLSCAGAALRECGSAPEQTRAIRFDQLAHLGPLVAGAPLWSYRSYGSYGVTGVTGTPYQSNFDGRAPLLEEKGFDMASP
jgi:hypothetical protein